MRISPINCSVVRISIHALREEGDHFYQLYGIHKNNFYPRPPRGGRLHLFQIQLSF